MREEDLYRPIKLWLESPNFDPNDVPGALTQMSIVAISAHIDWFDGSGEWMRPDITLAHVSRRKYEPAATLSLHSFEVKSNVRSLTSALFQSLSYSRISDFCYLAAPRTAGWTDQIEKVATRFGIGLIKFDNADNWGSYELKRAGRMQPDIALREQYIGAVFSSDTNQSDILGALGVNR